MINRLRTPLKVVEWLVAFLMAIVAAFSQADPSKWSDPFAAHVKFMVEWSIPLLVGLALSTFILKILRELVDRFATNKDGIQKTLDELQKAFFQGISPEDLYKHRVTLFKACFNPFFRTRFLKIYARSGTSYQKVKVRFTIDDEGVEKNEGVAGRAYFTNGMLVVLGLPEWPNPGDPNHPLCKEYCQKGFVSWQKAKALDVQSRSIAAVVVRSKAGKRWGVLVLDSRDPQGVSLSASKRAMMTLIGQILTNHV